MGNTTTKPLSVKSHVGIIIALNIICVLVINNSEKPDLWLNVISLNIALITFLSPDKAADFLGSILGSDFIRNSQKIIKRVALVIGIFMLVTLLLGLQVDPCNARDVEAEDCGRDATPQPTPLLVVVVIKDGVNFRSGPGTIYSIVGTGFAGQELTINASSGDWYLVLAPGREHVWIRSDLVQTKSGNLSTIPIALTIPAPPPSVPATSTPITICNPEQNFPVCGSNNCPADNTSQCNKEGTGYVCVWNPGLCQTDNGVPNFPPPLPVVPTSLPGNSTAVPFVCTQSWLESEMQKYANSLVPPISVAQLKQQLIIQGYDRNGNGQLDCDDYRALTGTG